jgi:CheY-like chemotaxis protein
MTPSQALAPHLPYLRRFARAISGSQSSGDAYAVATLESIIADPSSFNADLDPRLALYKVFLKVWGSVSVNVSGRAEDQPFAGSGAGSSGLGLQQLEALTPRSRVAFVLSAIEGFGPDHISTALSCTETEAVAMLDDAGRELASQIATDVLVIEDEPIIAIDIETLVESLGHKVIDIARTHREALAAARRKRPGLILADIQLADGSSGLDAVNDILSAFDVPVIFITAYPERLLTGERPEPAFLITKPFRPDMVKAVISQALFFGQKANRPAGQGRTAAMR